MAEGETIVTWNMPNWITVVLMVSVVFAVVGILAHVIGLVSGGTEEVVEEVEEE